MLQIKNIAASYGTSQVLWDISLVIEPGQVVTLIGRNGMGKSTTIKTLMGQLPVKGGSISFDGRDLSLMADFRIAQAGIGLVPEGRGIFPNLTVKENLICAAANRRQVSNPWVLDRVYEKFPRLKERETNLGSNLSGGEQQMLSIGRALMTNPRLLILDEATEGLAPLVRKEIWQCLGMLKGEGQSMLVIDKNLAPLSKLADRHYVIEKGRVVWTGDSAALVADGDRVRQYVGL
ncbi:ATP-binding cassette domain-containing protein [Paraburkholderia sp. CNPSo 3155]|uniref:ABC transporter ATP-binding protein n=1 Tax=Paraburkholderia atlantica TaxID=2654982 RepID=UPI00128D605E|nr:ABC transporter ATP-binding protein [Paraburkholderia atlantica]MPW10955.1 ATP-binding cassette domain-containing protein [Paraburkholderia atlantica]